MSTQDQEQTVKVKKTILVNGKEMTMAEVKKEILAQLPAVTDDAEFIALINAVIKVSEGGTRKSTGSKTQIFRDMIVEKGSLTEDEIWNLFKWGKHETLSTAWGFRKKGNPEDFVYIAFNRSADGVGTYSVVGTGPTPPAGYEKKAKAKDDEEFFADEA